MPFTRRPVQFAADMAYTYLKDYSTAIAVLKHGLKANPCDAALLNNLAYAYALNGQTTEASKTIDEARRLPSNLRSTEINICLKATEGLNEYRMGHPEEGKQLYIEAIRQANQLVDKVLERRAVLNFAREEVRANPSFDSSLLSMLDDIPDDNKEISQLKEDIKNAAEHRDPLNN